MTDADNLAEASNRRRHDWIPVAVSVAVATGINLTGIAFSYGALSQRVATLELLRLEARIEVAAQIVDIKRTVERMDSKLDSLLKRP